MKNSLLKRKIKQNRINHIQMEQELESNAKFCLNNILLLSDDPTIRETAFNCLFSIEQALEINQRLPEAISIDSQVRALIDGSSWFDMLLLPLSEVETDLYRCKGKTPPNYRLLCKAPHGSYVNYRFHTGELSKEFDTLYEALQVIASNPSPTKKEKVIYRKLTKAILFIDFGK